MTNHYVVDTGYLLELFKVDGRYNDDKHKIIDAKFKKAAIQGFRIYVPVSVLFEVATHIAYVDNGYRRKKLAEKLAIIVDSCVKKQNPWIITPGEELKSIEQLAETLLKFANEYAVQELSLTDTSVLLIAQELKKNRSDYKVHIWTTEHTLKAREPDTEPNPFV
jgi:hypothetical protein